MSAAAQTKIFGIRIGVDPKILIGGLIVVSGLLFWYNSRGDDEPSTPAAAGHPEPAATAAPARRSRIAAMRRATSVNDRETLRFRDIDPTRGDVDPTLRLDLLERLQSVQQGGSGRSLFEAGLTPQEQANLPKIIGPKIPIGRGAPGTPGTPNMGMPAAPVVNIPLKYYGFAKPTARGESNRGFFLDGDNILVAVEGDVVNHRYLVVELTPNSARMEDVLMKQGQTLPVIAEAQSP